MKLMILDGNSIINRTFYGIRMLTAPDGTPVNAVYGFLTVLHKLLEDERPDALCVAFDLKGPTFRHEQFEGYKAQRKPMPDELSVQIPLMKNLLDAAGVQRLELAGFEADDLIGTVSRICGESGNECLIVTGDRDSFQLITEHAHVLHVKSRMGKTETIHYTPEVFSEEYGFTPEKIVDLKALMGDASDNIPGVKGVGEKTATELIQKFGTVKRIYEDLDALDIKDSVRKKLADGRADAEMSYSLATIDTHAPIEFDPKRCLFSGSFNGAYAEFKKLGFNSLIEKWGLTPDASSAIAVSRPALQAAEVHEEELPALLDVVKAADYVAVLPLDGLDAIELCDGKTVYTLCWANAGDGYNAFLKVLFAPDVKKVSHNVKDLLSLLAAENIDAGGFVFDTALGGYLLDPTESGYALPRLAQKLLGEEKRGAEAVFALYPPMKRQLDAEGMTALMDEIELPLCYVLSDMERTGFCVDRQALYEYGQELSVGIDALQKEIYALAGEEFNINSPKQLGEILFEKLMLPAGKKTKSGYSTSAETLEKLRGKHEIIEKILEFRQLTKLKSTYVDGLGKVIGPDGRIHTSFQMTVTATGRLSSTEPNLQNIPVRTELGAEIRKMFVAPRGSVLVDADYSQIELRLLAHISGDKVMQKAFLDGEDIHAVTASQVFGVPLAEVTKLQRSHAKAVNFGIVYGISAFSLAQNIHVYQNEAREYIDTYLEKYSGVREYMKNIIAQAKADGYVTTLFGRRRPLPELKSSNYNIRSFGERVARNTPIQGTAADVIKLAMVHVWRRLRDEGLAAKLILQVHDELIVECPEAEAERVTEILTEEMENVVHYSVPLTADAKIGRSWSDAK
ncbi:MAG: DNA polymerase I [Oscillospiraceae bacterium]|jgi:DNA polymerase-1